jgi:hypothetical protein
VRIINLSISFVALWCSLSYSNTALAQVDIETYFDVGSTNISNGAYLRNAILGAYHFKNTKIEAGTQFDLIGASDNFLTGINLRAVQEITIKNFLLEAHGVFVYNPFSDLVHETNWGILAGITRTHFTIQLGPSFRTYTITKDARERFEIDENTSLHENWNVLYLVGYQFKPTGNKWNAGISVTNMDNFLINQETNPMILLSGNYKIARSVSVYSEAWYKNAGSLNISANHFGYFFRAGLIWELELK